MAGSSVLNQISTLSKLRDIHAYDDASEKKKETLHRVGKNFLKSLAKDIGLEPGSYDIRSNLGGVAVSGEVTLHSDHLYVQLSEGFMQPCVSVLYRTCNGRQDYSGDHNHHIDMNRLQSRAYDSLVAQCVSMIETKKLDATASKSPKP